METVAPTKRRSVIEAMPRPPGWRVGTDAAYSEYAGWQVLGWLLEDATGEELRPYLRRTILDPLGLHDTWIGMTAKQFRTVLPRLGVNLDLRDLEGFPMLIERSERMCTETNPAHGGYTTASDLARFYAALLQRLAGHGPDALPSPATLQRFCSTARPPVHDAVLDRVCSYGLGFMTSLADHAFGPNCSPNSFGHSGNVGSSFAFADPDHDLAVAVVFNGIVDHQSAFLRRPVLVRALYNDLGLDAPATEPSTNSPPHRLVRRFRASKR
jgi:CubicO group peptidase (beta-lactamase class C family)